MGDFSNALLTRVAPESRAQVRSAFERFAETLDLVTAEDEEKADREIVIANAGGGWTLVIGWTTALEAMALAVSNAIADATTLTCSLYDGDTTELALFANGKRVAKIATGQDAKIRSNKAWAKALATGTSLDDFFDELERLRDEGDVIDALAPMLGCSANALRGAEPEVGTITRLRFRLRERPRWEKSAEGPGKLDELEAMPVSGSSVRVGERHRSGIGGNNRGGAFHGLRIEIGGDAVARGLLVPTSVRVDASMQSDDGERIELDPPSRGSESVMTVANITVSAGRVERPTSGEMREPGASQASRAGFISLAIDAIARAPGTGTLHIKVSPADGSSGFECEEIVVVEPAILRPLRARPDEHSPALDILASNRFTSALVVYDCARDVAADHARELFAIILADPSHGFEGRITDATGGVTSLDPNQEEMLAHAMRSAPIVAVDSKAPLVVNPFTKDFSAHPSARFGAPVSGNDPSAPTAIVSVPFGTARDALHAAIARGIERGLILQASLGSWGEAPSIVSTPYEKAVGIDGKHATRKSWVTRYLRVVGDDTVWIGAPLAAHLSKAARAAVEQRATCETLTSGALVITVGGRDKRRAVEEALEALLPTASDFRMFRQRSEGRLY